MVLMDTLIIPYFSILTEFPSRATYEEGYGSQPKICNRLHLIASGDDIFRSTRRAEEAPLCSFDHLNLCKFGVETGFGVLPHQSRIQWPRHDTSGKAVGCTQLESLQVNPDIPPGLRG